MQTDTHRPAGSGRLRQGRDPPSLAVLLLNRAMEGACTETAAASAATACASTMPDRIQIRPRCLLPDTSPRISRPSDCDFGSR